VSLEVTELSTKISHLHSTFGSNFPCAFTASLSRSLHFGKASKASRPKPQSQAINVARGHDLGSDEAATAKDEDCCALEAKLLLGSLLINPFLLKKGISLRQTETPSANVIFLSKNPHDD